MQINLFPNENLLFLYKKRIQIIFTFKLNELWHLSNMTREYNPVLPYRMIIG
jgi:hypothetical protein